MKSLDPITDRESAIQWVWENLAERRPNASWCPLLMEECQQVVDRILAIPSPSQHLLSEAKQVAFSPLYQELNIMLSTEAILTLTQALNEFVVQKARALLTTK